MAEHILHTDTLRAAIPGLDMGDRVVLSGVIYTARDAAHKRLFSLLDSGEDLPLRLSDSVIYYASPTPAPTSMPDIAVGACGPTTSSRMDPFTPRLLDLGLPAMIGKGERSQAVIDAMVRNGSVYLCAIGGAGTLISRHITAMEEIAFSDLGCESIKRMEIDRMPLTVAIDCRGRSIFAEGRRAYARAD